MNTREKTKARIRHSGAWLVVLAAPFMASSALAQTGTLFVTGNQVGVGTDAPDQKMHVKDGDFKVEQTAGGTAAKLVFTTAASEWEIKQNGVTGRLTFANTGTAGAPFKFAPTATDNLFRVGIAGPSTVDINGSLVITGGCTGCADYVFEDDYELRPLDEVAAFISENGHLPNIPSADEMQQTGYNVGHMSGRLLEKVEELTLYTLQQQKMIDELQVTIHELRAEK